MIVTQPDPNRNNMPAKVVVQDGAGKATIIDKTRLKGPVDVALSGDTFYVLDAHNNNILSYSWGGSAWNYAKSWSWSKMLPEQKCTSSHNGAVHGAPDALAVSPDGKIYVALAVNTLDKSNCKEKAITDGVVALFDPAAGTVTVEP